MRQNGGLFCKHMAAVLYEYEIEKLVEELQEMDNDDGKEI